MTEVPSPQLRISDQNRESALSALGEHMTAGRIDIDEYGERSARASVATTAPELAELFDDLPAPHPPLPGVPGPPLPAAPPAPPARVEPSGLEVWGPRLVALSPFIAVALFLLRVGLQLALLHEAHDEIQSDEPLLCPHCGHVVPDMAFCPACGVATRASSRSSRTARRDTRPVRTDRGPDGS